MYCEDEDPRDFARTLFRLRDEETVKTVTWSTGWV